MKVYGCGMDEDEIRNLVRRSIKRGILVEPPAEKDVTPKAAIYLPDSFRRTLEKYLAEHPEEFRAEDFSERTCVILPLSLNSLKIYLTAASKEGLLTRPQPGYFQKAERLQ